MDKVTIVCDRCGKKVEGLIEPGVATSGFYRVDMDGGWSKYKHSQDEKVICDDCMFASPLYWQDYPQAAYSELGKRLRAIQLENINMAFNRAEEETAAQFNSQTCSMPDKDGDHTCPICFFRKRAKFYMGLDVNS